MKKSVIRLTEQDIRNMIREAVENILCDDTNNDNSLSIPQLEDWVGYSFDPEDPSSFINDFYMCFMDVISNARDRENGIEPTAISDYEDLTVEQLEPYIPVLRKAAEESLQKLFLEYKKKVEESYQILNKCEILLNQYKQGR